MEDEVAITSHCEGNTAVTEGVSAVSIQVTDWPIKTKDTWNLPAIDRVVGVESHRGVGQETDANDPDVLEEDVNRVFLLGKTCFQRSKSKVHDKDHRSSDHGPEHGGSEKVEGVGGIALTCEEFFVAGFSFIDLLLAKRARHHSEGSGEPEKGLICSWDHSYIMWVESGSQRATAMPTNDESYS